MTYIKNKDLKTLLEAEYLVLYKNNDGKCVLQTTKWDTLYNAHFKGTTIPEKMEDILIAPYEKLVDIYIKYQEVKKTLTVEEMSAIEDCFPYTNKYDNKIADFFINHSKELEISTCHYCEMSFINDFIANMEDGTTEKRRQFDIDHVLDKGSCPLVALSLYNFVPSCQVCNSRLKLDKVLGHEKQPAPILSPTCDDYVFDDVVKIEVLPTDGFSYSKMLDEDNEKFELNFRNDNGAYEPTIRIFHLNERYRIHKVLALKWIYLHHKYVDSAVEMLNKDLGIEYPSPEIEADLFEVGEKYHYHQCFEKYKRDTLRLCKERVYDEYAKNE